MTKSKNRTKKADSQKKAPVRNNRKTSSGKGKRKPVKEPGFIGADIVLLFLLTFCVLLFLGNIELAGSAGRALKAFQTGMFGTAGYVFPFFLGWAILMAHVNFKEKPGLTVFKITAAFVAYISICGILELVGGGAGQVNQTLKDYYMYGGENLGGGLFGGLFYTGLYPVIGIPGSYLTLIVLLLIALEMTKGRSLIKPVLKRGQEIYEDYQANEEIRRETRALKAEEEALLKRDRQKEMLKELETRRSEVHVRSLEFGEDTRLTDGETAAETAAAAEAVKDKKRTKSSTDTSSSQEDQWKSLFASEPAGKTGLDAKNFVKRGKRTIAELEALDGKDEPEIDLMMPDSPMPAGRVFEKTNSDIPAADDTLAEEKEIVFEPVIHMPEKTVPAEEPDEIDDGMSAYDDYIPAAVPTAEEIENITASEKPASAGTDRKEPGAGGKDPKASASPAQGGDIWRKGGPSDGNSGVTFTKPAVPDVKPEAPVVKKEYKFPPLSLLKGIDPGADISTDSLKATAMKLQQTLRDFGVGVTVTDISCGPTVTRYELQPDQGVKVSRITSLADDIKLNLAATEIRIEAPIPGKAAVGIEVPNVKKQMVRMREILESPEFKKSASKLTIGVGKGISGDVVVTDLARMPHLLIAGATGSGKSVCINTLIVSILYKASPEEVKFIMVDPKQVELSAYNGIPHLLIPVVTDPKMAAGALNWAVQEMTGRFQKFAEAGVRDIKAYNKKVMNEELEDAQKLPQIVVVVDEMADLMMVAAKEVEDAICRLAALARAAGIHLVLATQRPVAEVITGLIKANVQSRIALSVQSGMDSRIILDKTGAENLLGNGDMLFYPSSYPNPVRVQGAFLSDEEIAAVIKFLSDQTDEPATNKALEQSMNAAAKDAGTVGAGARDELFADAGRFIIEKDKASIGNLQRAFRIGFNRAARIMDQLADYGVVSEDNGTKAREILMTMEQFESLLEQLDE